MARFEAGSGVQSVSRGGRLMKKILLVANDPECIEAVKDFFEVAGMPVRYAYSREVALLFLHRGKFDVMITDLNMHPANGIELAKKAALIAPQMSIIMTTGNISPELLETAKDIGIAAVIAKPVDMTTLMQLIDDIIEIS
jgi:DNA-binding NtrC family response regulator